MPPLTIHTETFQTLKAATAYTRALFARVGVTLDLQSADPEAYAFVWALLQRHPRAAEKLKDVVKLEINEVAGSRDNKRVYGVWVIRSDGSRDDIAAIGKCINGRDSTPKAMLLAAMRQAIEPQIKQHRRLSASTICAACGESVDASDSHVDHIITFSELTNKFLHGRMDVPTTFDSDADSTTHRRFKAADKAFEDAWVTFHAKEAKLQITCAQCNLKTLRALRG